mgnify:CR=1 FL=1
MKQGQIVNKIVMGILFAAVVIYLAVSAVTSLSDPLFTTVSYTYSVDDAIEVTGFLVREEQSLGAQTAYADILPAEGEKVAKGERVAYLYQDASALERRSQIQALSLQLEQMEYTLSKPEDQRSSAKLTQDILQDIVDLRADVARGDLTEVAQEALDLKSLIYRREFAYGEGDVAVTQQTISSLRSQISALQASASRDTQVVIAPVSGVFSGLVDGYESLLTPALLESLTPSGLGEIARRTVAADESAVGKLITDSRWYFVCTLSEEEARRLVEGEQITLRFSRDWSGEVTMDIERLSEPENGSVLAVFSATRCLADTTLRQNSRVAKWESCTKVDDYTVAIKLKEPNSSFINQFTQFQIVSPKALEEGTDLNKAEAGTGQYTFKEHTEGDHVTVVPYADYWGTKATVDSLTFRAVPEDGSRVAMLQTGEADYIYPMPTV